MNILVVGRGAYPGYMTMYGSVIHYDSSIHFDLPKVDLILLTGGSDVNPRLYGESTHSKTITDSARDRSESWIIKQAFSRGIPCVGICRGGQILSVMNGDKLVQDVTGHDVPHNVIYKKDIYRVTSTHHQMMTGLRGEVLAWSSDLSDHYEGGGGRKMVIEDKREPEAVWYDVSSCLCVQFHPEHYHSYDSSTLFNKLMEEYIL